MSPCARTLIASAVSLSAWALPAPTQAQSLQDILDVARAARDRATEARNNAATARDHAREIRDTVRTGVQTITQQMRDIISTWLFLGGMEHSLGEGCQTIAGCPNTCDM